MTPPTISAAIEGEPPVALNTTCSRLQQCGMQDDDALDCIEVGLTYPTRERQSRLKVIFWNVERGYTPEYASELLSNSKADIALLCELDNGVARTGQRHVTRDIAHQVGANYLYAVEFIELESREKGELGYHGNAILSHVEMSDPLLVRLADDGLWQSGERRARRLGSRIALATRAMLDSKPVVFVTTHLESHARPAFRALQMRALLDAIDQYANGDPVLIGGDFNTRTASKDDLRPKAARLKLNQEFPALFTSPQAREPLFGIAAAAGYDWVGSNTTSPTERKKHSRDDTPRFRLDWFFTKGLICENPGVLTAESESGAALSDHDALTLDIRLS